MSDFLRRTWAQINLDNIVHNFETLKALLDGDSQIMAVIKADAYGHGDSYVAHALRQKGVKWFGVANIEEAISLRNAGIEEDILVFSFTPCTLAQTLCRYDITQAVYSLDYAKQLNSYAEKENVKVKCHLKLDTGMGRLGFLGYESKINLYPITKTLSLPALNFGGVFTHFSSADENTEDSRQFTREQFLLFLNICNALEDRGFYLGLKHCCNSAATISFPEMHMDLVRPGIALYGHAPSEELRGKVFLKPAMELFSTIAMIKTVEEGYTVSYNRTYKAEPYTKIASIPMGYADGYPRILSNRSSMIVNGEFAPVAGRICMDNMMLNITDINANEGDVVTVFGNTDGKSMSVETIAKMAGTIPYELICAVGKRVSRVYMQNGAQIAVTKYKDVVY